MYSYNARRLKKVFGNVNFLKKNDVSVEDMRRLMKMQSEWLKPITLH